MARSRSRIAVLWVYVALAWGAVTAWSLSLFLGVVTYFLLNHIYSWAPR